MDEREKMERDRHAQAYKESEHIFNAFINAITAVGLVVFAVVIIGALAVTGVWAVMEYWQWLNR